MMDPASTLFRSINSPLIVITAASNGQTGGCVAGFHTQCSIDPVRYAVWLSKANHTFRVALFASHVAIHFLDAGDHATAELFGGTTGDDVDKFALVDWSAGPGGVPLLAACPHRLVLRRTTLWDDSSDHVCLVGEPVDVSVGPDELVPLRIADADDIVAGHDAASRTAPANLAGSSRNEVPADVLRDIAAGAGHAIDLREN